jgi:hypothetical protein
MKKLGIQALLSLNDNSIWTQLDLHARCCVVTTNNQQLLSSRVYWFSLPPFKRVVGIVCCGSEEVVVFTH